MPKNQELSEIIKKIKYLYGINQGEIASKIGVTSTYLSDTINGRTEFSSSLKSKIYEVFSKVEKEEPAHDGIPFYENLPVSAGQADLIHITQGEHPTGYISLPGVSAIAAFPVVGCSMEPEIKPGDFIAVSPMTSLDSVDPDKTYMIITDDDRMIKHLLADPSDPSILWAHSPNYPRFPIQKTAIKALYKIQFHGRIL